MERLSTEEAIIKIMESPKGREIAHLCYYQWDAKEAYKRFLLSEEWSAVKKILSRYHLSSSKALDLGSGNGIGSYALYKSGYDVVSLEPDPSGLVGYGALKSVLAQENLPIHQINAFGESLPFPDSRFGLVYCRQVLHHASDLQKMINEIARVMVKGGVFIGTREHVVDDDVSLGKFFENHALHRFTKSEGAFSLKKYLLAIENAGLNAEKVLLPWDSVINHYPYSNLDLHTEFKAKMKKRFGKFGKLANFVGPFEIFYRQNLSVNDRRPGRMVSFVAVKK